MSLTYSKLESQRFNLNVHRGSFEQFDFGLLKNYINSNEMDVLIFRVPAEYQHQMHQLNELNKELIYADTLVYYKAKFPMNNKVKIFNQDLKFVTGTENEMNVLSDLVERIFVNYSTHYFSNPLFKKELILEGYKEWAMSYLGNENRTVFLVMKEGRYVGFAACSFNGDFSDGILYGVDPEYEGKKIYSDLLNHTVNYFQSKGLSYMLYSTQIQNYAVQKALPKYGFYMDKAYVTVHVNCKKI